MKIKRSAYTPALMALYNSLTENLGVMELIAKKTGIQPARVCAVILEEDLRDLSAETEEYMISGSSPAEFKSLQLRSMTVLEEARELLFWYEKEANSEKTTCSGL